LIIEGLIKIIFNILSLVISQFNVPPAPEEFINAIPDFFGFLEMADGFIALVFPIDLTPFIAITLVIMAVEHGYPFIMWILRKIPFLGIN